MEFIHRNVKGLSFLCFADVIWCLDWRNTASYSKGKLWFLAQNTGINSSQAKVSLMGEASPWCRDRKEGGGLVEERGVAVQLWPLYLWPRGEGARKES